jgi:hypothetical protein
MLLLHSEFLKGLYACKFLISSFLLTCSCLSINPYNSSNAVLGSFKTRPTLLPNYTNPFLIFILLVAGEACSKGTDK